MSDTIQTVPNDIVQIAEEEGVPPLELLGEMADKELAAEEPPHTIGMRYLAIRLSCSPRYENECSLGYEDQVVSIQSYLLKPYQFYAEFVIRYFPKGPYPLDFQAIRTEEERTGIQVDRLFDSFRDLADSIDDRLQDIGQRLSQKTREEP